MVALMPNVKLTLSVDDKLRRAFAMRAGRLGLSQSEFFTRFIVDACKEEITIIERDSQADDKRKKKDPHAH